MSKLSAAEIERHFEDSRPADDVLTFEPPAYDEVIEVPYDYAEDDWLFDDYCGLDDHYDDRYDDQYPHEDDIYY